MPSLTPISGLLEKKKAAHLLRRTTFGPSATDIETFAAKSIDEAIIELFADIAIPEPPVDTKTGKTWLNPKATDANNDEDFLTSIFMGWHLEQMRKSGNSIKEKITYFFHTHLPTRRSIIRNSEPIYYQNTLFRHYAFGSFKELFRMICIDNAMLIYLDGASNDYGEPNENFGREMLELYSIGKGPQIEPENYTNYTETDIREAARVLTGFTNDIEFETIDEATGIPRGKLVTNAELKVYMHDPGVKQFSELFQNRTIQPNEVIDGFATEAAVHDELDQLMDMIFDQEETAKFICRKLYQHFVYYDITDKIEQDIIIPLASTFRDSDYNMQTVLEQLLKSEHFFDMDTDNTKDHNIGAIIKSPIELILGTLRFFNIQLPDNPTELYEVAYNTGILKFIEDQGLNFYEPFEVAGYPAYHQFPIYHRNWITPTNLAYRYKFIETVLNGQDDGNNDIGFNLDIVNFVDSSTSISEPSNPETLVQELTENLISVDLTQERFDFFLNDILLENLSASEWTNEWNAYKSTNDDLAVRAQLEKLVISIIQTPEYQLF